MIYDAQYRPETKTIVSMSKDVPSFERLKLRGPIPTCHFQETLLLKAGLQGTISGWTETRSSHRHPDAENFGIPNSNLVHMCGLKMS